MKEKNQVNKIIVFTALIWLTSNYIHPVNPTFFQELKLPNHVFGTSFAVMIFVNFLTSPFWGRLGDKYSHKKVLVLSTALYALSLAIYAFTKTLFQVLLLRGISGFFGAGFMVSLLSLMVLETNLENRSKKIVISTSIGGIAMSLGYLVGGALGYLPVKYVFLIQAAQMLLVSIFAFFLIEEKKVELLQERQTVISILKNKNLDSRIFTSWFVTFLIISFFISLASASNNHAFNYYLKANLHFKPIVNGIWKSGVGVIGLIANMTISVWIIKNTNVRKAFRFILILLFVNSSLMFYFENLYPFMTFSVLYFTSHLIIFPMMQSFAVENVESGPGITTGIYNAIKALGLMVGALAAGFSYDFGNKLPFLLSAVGLLIAIIISIVRNRDFENNQ